MRTAARYIDHLEPHQVFVFGSNEGGFHGAGSAGFAMRGTARNTWRSDGIFQKAMSAPKGHPDRIGKWATYGVGRGFQEGTEGKSYAIATIIRAGQHCSQPLREILNQLFELGDFARKRPELEFLMTISGGGYSGWSVENIQGVYNSWYDMAMPPDNILVPPDYVR